jgi:hypothetical protein
VTARIRPPTSPATTEGHPNREIALEELLMLWLANANPRSPLRRALRRRRPGRADRLRRADRRVPDLLRRQPGFGADGKSLIAFLRAPALASPDSLAGQLRYIRSRWGLVLTASSIA